MVESWFCVCAESAWLTDCSLVIVHLHNCLLLHCLLLVTVTSCVIQPITKHLPFPSIKHLSLRMIHQFVYSFILAGLPCLWSFVSYHPQLPVFASHFPLAFRITVLLHSVLVRILGEIFYFSSLFLSLTASRALSIFQLTISTSYSFLCTGVYLFSKWVFMSHNASLVLRIKGYNACVFAGLLWLFVQ